MAVLTSRVRRAQRGQGTVEFSLFLVMLTLTLMLLIQLTWVGIQKWHFNFVSLYTARSWSVAGTSSPNSVRIKVLAAEGVHHTRMATDLYFATVVLSSEKSSTPSRWSKKFKPSLSTSMKGIQFTGVGTIMPMFAGGAKRGGVNASLEGGLAGFLGQFQFETYIPMEREPAEHTSGPKRDNDCSSYGALDAKCSGNGR